MIINASPLIFFGRTDNLKLLKNTLRKIVIAPAVYNEVVIGGKQMQAFEATVIEEEVAKGEIEVKKLALRWQEEAISVIRVNPLIDIGEAETIALALQEKEKMVLIDEKSARKAAILHGLECHGSLWVLLQAFQKKLVDENRIRAILAMMSNLDFRVGADIITEFWALFEMLKKRPRRR